MTTRDRLVIAALEVVSERGYRGATTKEIAARAGLSEMTLFRHFATKAELGRAALEHATEPFRAGSAGVSDDVTADLTALASGYVAFVDAWPELVDRVLPEVTSDPELGPMAVDLLTRNAEAVQALIAHHQELGNLVDEDLDDLVRAFLGPLLTRAALRHVLAPKPFDAAGHVRRFLEGSRS